MTKNIVILSFYKKPSEVSLENFLNCHTEVSQEAEVSQKILQTTQNKKEIFRLALNMTTEN